MLKGDRLEPCAAVPYIEDFGDVAQFPPVGVVFWRVVLESMTRHRNPIFDKSIGLTPTMFLTVDTLHAVYLGFMK